MKNVGILGGSFNPIHIAHIKLAKLAIKEAKLDEVIIIPTFLTNLKDNSSLVSPEHRLKMCNLAVENENDIYVSDIDIRRNKITYTSDTIYELKQIENNNYFLIMGADSYKNLSLWHDYQYIVSNAKIIVARRDDISKSDILDIAKKNSFDIPVILSKPIQDLSSTIIRYNIKNDITVSELLDKKVLEYIKINNLYR